MDARLTYGEQAHPLFCRAIASTYTRPSIALP